jgi:regulator of cell morphogenesis and NO signaling
MEATSPLKQILQRYAHPLENNLLHSYHELKDLNVDQNFIYALLRSFENENDFSSRDYSNFPLEIIVDYIRRTHRLYLSKKLGEIEQSIDILLENYDDNHPLLLVLKTFFRDYKGHLTTHIKYEERQLLPYIDSLIEAGKGNTQKLESISSDQNFRIQTFIDSHSDTEDDLSEVRSTILRYNPPATNQTPYRILITQLEMFESDLKIHGLIEDKVLVPRAQQLEQVLCL